MTNDNNAVFTCPSCGGFYSTNVDKNQYNWVSKCPHCRATTVVTKSSYPLVSGKVDRQHYIPEQEAEEYKPPPDGTQVRCDNPKCGKDLIGIWEGGLLHIKYRERSMRVEGIVWVPCRRCNKMVMIDTAAQPTAINAFGDDYTLTVSEVDATDAARGLAVVYGIDLSKVKGTGKDGRIIKSDIEILVEEKYGD